MVDPVLGVLIHPSNLFAVVTLDNGTLKLKQNRFNTGHMVYGVRFPHYHEFVPSPSPNSPNGSSL